MGTGEVTHFIAQYGLARVAKAVLIDVIPPFLLQTADNPDGVPQQVFTHIKTGLKDDRPAYLIGSLKKFYNVGLLASEVRTKPSNGVGIPGSSGRPSARCIDAWLEDFSEDCAKIDVPTLIIHGDADQTLPIDATARRLVGKIAGSRLEEIAGAPHGL